MIANPNGIPNFSIFEISDHKKNLKIDFQRFDKFYVYDIIKESMS
jgi:hypothetical protein